MLDEIAQKSCRKTKTVNDRGSIIETLNEIKPFKNKNKNPQSFL